MPRILHAQPFATPAPAFQPPGCPGVATPSGIAPLHPHAGSIATRLGLARRRAGLFRDEVAERLGWPPGRLAELELGQRLPQLADLVALARLYRVDIEFFRPPGGDARSARTFGSQHLGHDDQASSRLPDAA
jgi:hypothetical protein